LNRSLFICNDKLDYELRQIYQFSWIVLNITYILLLFTYFITLLLTVCTVYYIFSRLCCNCSAMYILSSWVYDLLDSLTKLSIYKPGNASRFRWREYLFHIFNDNEEFQWNSKKYYIDIDYLWNTAFFVCFLGIKIHHGWDRSFNSEIE